MITAGFVVCFQFNQLSCFLGVAQRPAKQWIVNREVVLNPDKK